MFHLVTDMTSGASEEWCLGGSGHNKIAWGVCVTSLTEVLQLVKQPEVTLGRVERVRLPGRGLLQVRIVAPPNPSAATILLLHGWTATADLNFSTLYGPLSGRWGLIAPDHRGHGGGIRSMDPFSLEGCADDAAALVDQLGIGPVIVLGYSMGGPIALLLARYHPEMVSSVVLCATAMHFGHGSAERAGMAVLGAAGRAAQVATEHIRHRLGGHMDGVVSGVDTALRSARRLIKPPNLDDFAGPRLPIHDLAQVAEAGGELRRFDARPWIEEIRVPTAVVVTTNDHTVPPMEQDLLASRLPDCRRFEVKGDHAVCLAPNQNFESTICAAIESVSPEWAEIAGVRRGWVNADNATSMGHIPVSIDRNHLLIEVDDTESFADQAG